MCLNIFKMGHRKFKSSTFITCKYLEWYNQCKSVTCAGGGYGVLGNCADKSKTQESINKVTTGWPKWTPCTSNSQCNSCRWLTYDLYVIEIINHE